MHAVHSESIQTPLLFPHFVTLQPYCKMYSIVFTLINLHTIPHKRLLNGSLTRQVLLIGPYEHSATQLMPAGLFTNTVPHFVYQLAPASNSGPVST
jgi:hypothetical protein